MDINPVPVNNPKPLEFNNFRNPIQPQTSHNLPIQNISQSSQIHLNPINQINTTSLVELKIPEVRPFEMKVTVTI